MDEIQQSAEMIDAVIAHTDRRIGMFQKRMDMFDQRIKELQGQKEVLVAKKAQVVKVQ
jgi:hypothetical protein